MVNNVYKFRRVKWGNPHEKLKVLAEDIRRKVWLDRLSHGQFGALVAAAALFAFALATTAAVYLAP
ncbi:hypothetical protein AB3G45_17630 [Shinella sp. S4-D37]|uniref:hypothetical protein n=1 Tax=Shinella sp. S4-D37 TaxID=3161999 RepID=UPI00346716BC